MACLFRIDSKAEGRHELEIIMLISAKDISKKYVEKPIVDHQDLSIEENDRIGLIGVNGCGKSTLLKILAGQEDYDGEILKSRDLKMAFLAQEPKFEKSTIEDELRYRNSLNKEPAEEFMLKAAASRFELPFDQTPIETLSGGMKRRLDLACVLLSDANLLLLDEPTNHLDNDMIEWLENQLSRTKAAIVMVTHDRYFLEKISNEILELDHSQLYLHLGGYADYLENKAIRQEQAEASQRKLNNLYRHELEWVRAGVQARSTKSKSRLQRFEELRSKRHSLAEKNLNLQIASSRLGKKTVEWKNISFGYVPSKPLIRDFSYQTKRTDRIGLIGPNGAGKSTFLNLLAGFLQPDSGEFEWGETVRVGYFKQTMDSEDLDIRVIDYVRGDTSEVDTDTGTVRAEDLLEQFLFEKDQYYLPLSRLSGGERRRLYLLKILMKAPNMLILDEPTNDLDLVSLEVLEDYLDSFPGIVLTVSHDRSFLDRVCDVLFVIQDDHSIRQYPGGYSELLASLEEEKKAEKADRKQISPAQKPKRTEVRFTSNDKQALLKAEEAMESLNRQIEETVKAMENEADYEKVAKLSARMSELENTLAETEEKWMALEEKREAAGK